MQNERQPGGHGELQVLPLLPHLSPQCCHRQREGAGGTGPESSARGAGRAGVGRAVVQAERRWREASQSGLAMWSALCVGLLPIVAISLASAATLLQPKELTVQEGKDITIPCSMQGDSMRYYTMSWYRQGPSGAQEWIYKADGSYGEGFQDRFTIQDVRTRSRFPLKIRAAKLEDAATYYCGARPGTTPWGRVTGPGTTLTVLPKVIVEKSTKAEDLTTTGKTTPLPTTKNLETSTMEQNTSASTTEVMCTDKFDSNVVTILPEEEAEGPVAGPSERVCNSTEPSAQDAEGHRVNMLSMAVLGFRVLLAKSIAINTLMSIKLFLL